VLPPGERLRSALATAAVAGIVAVAVPGPAAGQAGEEAPWPMAGRDATHSGTTGGPVPPYREAWRRDVGMGGPVAGPVVGAGAVVAIAEEGVAALDPETGEILWTAPRSEGASGPPAIAGAVVIHASGTEDSASLVARGVDDGRERWRAYLGGPVGGGVAVDGGIVYVGTRAGILFGFDVRSGEQRFRFASRGAADGTPAVAGGLVLGGWEDRGTGISTVRAMPVDSGVEERAPEWEVSGGPSPVTAAAVAARERAAFVALGDGTVRAVGLESGEERWQDRLRDVPSEEQVPAAGEALVVADRLHVARLDPATGEERWAYRLADLQSLGDGRFNTLARSAPAVVGDGVLIGDATGVLSAVDLASGHRVWRADLGRGSVAPPAADAERVYAATLGPGGEVVALEHNPDGRRIDQVSPTVLSPLRAVLNFLAAFVLASVIILGVFRYALPGRRPPRPEQARP
jgi:outer membrane protein assembly factor BamB